MSSTIMSNNSARILPRPQNRPAVALGWRGAVLGAALLAGCGAAAEPAATAAAPARPNIVMIVADDHGTDGLGCYGNPVVRTPNLDALAADGTRFTAAFCTTASCSPSRATILSGLQSHHNGMYGLQHDEHHFQSFDSVRSLSVILAEAGYRTARIGKYHIAPEKVFAFQTVLSEGHANDPKTIGRSPVEMAEMSRGVIEAKDDRPFFLYYATDDPHRSNAFRPDGKPTFKTYPNPNSFGNRPQGYPGVTPVAFRPEDVVVPSYLPDNEATRLELAQYYQSIARLDQGVGKLIGVLKAAGKYENTLILYLSDNGPAFPGSKTTLYEPGMRLPLLVRAPGRQHPGALQSAMVSWADLTPTVLDVAGVAYDEKQFDGRSFRAGLDGGALAGWDRVFASHTFHQITMYYPMRVIRTPRYKLIHNLAHELTFPLARDLVESSTWISAVLAPKQVRGPDTEEKTPTWLPSAESERRMFGQRTVAAFLHRPEYELYDLEQDPDEVNNLTDDPGHAAVKQQLMAELTAFQRRTRDPWENP
ncbi:sulfatase [Horticoccus luteus]|uniref:Sulfatase n=1 Tax=Horticoccus luteus TaxID=2862869 RepID=A0A8F9XGS4_9BACT|nr:sulfatase [Horticoccus luteus]QYM78550.1 sulfatase [Horticoccus luteus]